MGPWSADVQAVADAFEHALVDQAVQLRVGQAGVAGLGRPERHREPDQGIVVAGHGHLVEVRPHMGGMWGRYPIAVR